jgi:hypothetical protein
MTRHHHELEEAVAAIASSPSQLHVHVDRAMMGLGGYDSWSPNVAPQHLIETGRRWEFSLVLVSFSGET